MPGVLVGVLLAVAAVLLGASSGRSGRSGYSGSQGSPDAARAVDRGTGQAPMILDLLAAMLSVGASVERALAIVAASCEAEIGAALLRVHAARDLGASWDTAWDTARDTTRAVGTGAGSAPGPGPGREWWSRRQRERERRREDCLADIRRGLRFATSTGAPSAALLHAHAAQLRRRHNRVIERRAAALGVQLVLPLGLCSLPAFICLGVVPVVLGLLPAL